MNIVLIGFMASGKTSTGRYISTRRGMRFLDMDHELERMAGMSIPDFFAAKGEAAFRDLESELCAQLQTMRHTVISTGGGVVVRDANRPLLRAAGMVVWLQTTAEHVLHYGTRKGVQQRPVLARIQTPEELQALMDLRTPMYAQTAHFQLQAWKMTLPQLHESINEFCEEYLAEKLSHP